MQTAQRDGRRPAARQVVTRTFEAGVRGGLETNLRWNAGWFRADNRNDILFVASEQTGFGYFKNFGKTLRQGIEVGPEQPDMAGQFGRRLHVSRRDVPEPGRGQRSGNSTNEEAEDGIPGSKEPSRSSRAIGFRSSRGTCSRPTPISRSPRNCWSISGW